MQLKQKCRNGFICKFIPKCWNLHSKQQYDLNVIYKKMVKKKYSNNLPLLLFKYKTETKLLDFDIPVYLYQKYPKQAYIPLIYQVQLTKGIRQGKLIILANKFLGQFGNPQDQLNIIKQYEESKFKTFMDQQKIREGIQNGSIIKGKYFSPNKVILENNQTINIQKQNQNRTLNNCIVYIKKIKNYEQPQKINYIIVNIEYQKVYLTGIILKTQKKILFISKNKHYPAMFITQIDKSLQNQIKKNQLPYSFFLSNIQQRFYHNYVFCGQLLGWQQYQLYPRMRLTKLLGKLNQNNIFIHSILFQQNITIEQETIQQKQQIQQFNKYTQEIKSQRLDLRDLFTFTIDSEKTKSFDDAISIVNLSDNNFQIYLHISDVDYYLKDKPHIMKKAKKRLQTLYLVERNIEMLPSKLAYKICSLNKNEIKYTYSMILKMNEQGNIDDNIQFKQTIIEVNQNYELQQIDKMEKNPYNILPQPYKNGKLLLQTLKAKAKKQLNKIIQYQNKKENVKKQLLNLLQHFNLTINEFMNQRICEEGLLGKFIQKTKANFRGFVCDWTRPIRSYLDILGLQILKQKDQKIKNNLIEQYKITLKQRKKDIMTNISVQKQVEKYFFLCENKQTTVLIINKMQSDKKVLVWNPILQYAKCNFEGQYKNELFKQISATIEFNSLFPFKFNLII